MSLVDFLPGHEEKKLGMMIIDYSQIALSTVFATFKSKEQLNTKDIKTVILNTLRANVRRFKDKHPEIVIAIDSRNYWRKDVAHYYKGHRAKSREASDWNFEIIYKAMNEMQDDLKNFFPYKVLDVYRCEADDIAGVLVKYFHDKYENILLISSDGDWAQLQKYPHVKQYSSIQSKFVKPKHGGPRQSLLYKIIKGDKKDAVSNIKSPRDAVIAGTRQTSITEVSFDKWSKMKPEDFCTEEMLERYRENEKLLDLTQVPTEYEDAIISMFSQPPISSRAKIYPYLIKNGYSSMVDKINDF